MLHTLRSRRDWFTLGALGALTVGVFWRVWLHEFVNYDDPDYVTENPWVQRGLTHEGIAWAFGALHGRATYWHPLTWLSHMLDWEWFGANAGAHHLVSVFWHTSNVVLLFVVLRRMTGAFWRSALVTAFFAVHPLAVESVAWAAERKNVLSTFFWLLMLWTYVRYAERPTLGRYWPVPVCFGLGLMAKPILVTWPFALLLLDGWPMRRWRPRDPRSASGRTEPIVGERFPQVGLGRLFLEKVPLLLLSLGAGVAVLVAHHRLGMVGFDHGLTMWLRLENAMVSVGRYAGKLFWPSDLCAIYPHPGRWPLTMVVGSALFVILVTAWALREARRHSCWMVGWLWFLVLLLPTLGLVQVGSQAMADRFVYLPAVGLHIMLVWGVGDLLREERHARVILGLLAGSALWICSVAASFQLRHWRNSTALYERAIAVTRNNFVAHSNLGYTLEKQGRLDEAMWHLAEALRIRPEFAEARYQAGLILGRVQGPAAAEAQYREVIRLDPNWALPRLELAKVLVRLNKFDEAVSELGAVLRLSPADADAHSLLAMLLAARQQPAEAIGHYQEAVRLRPDWADALNNLAWLRATHPQAEFRDGEEAVRLATRACESTRFQKAMFVGTLAAAYAEAGRFTDAISTAEKARALAVASGETNLAATNAKLLEFYRQGKAHREETR